MAGLLYDANSISAPVTLTAAGVSDVFDFGTSDPDYPDYRANPERLTFNAFIADAAGGTGLTVSVKASDNEDMSAAVVVGQNTINLADGSRYAAVAISPSKYRYFRCDFTPVGTFTAGTVRFGLRPYYGK